MENSTGNDYPRLNGVEFGHLAPADDKEQLLIYFSQLRSSMKARMEELSVFYDEHFDDDKIHFFEKLRMKIKKTLQQKVESIRRANGGVENY